MHKWHGDVGQSKKQKVLRSPGGVLLITPESIESLFINHPDKLNKLFSNLSYIVIDELHAFLGTDRGAHLRSLLARLIQRVNNEIRIIGLSATLGDMESAKHWIDWRNPEDVDLIKMVSIKKIKYLVKGYQRLKTGSERGEGADDEEIPKSDASPDDFRLAKDIISAFSGKTALLFANLLSILPCAH